MKAPICIFFLVGLVHISENADYHLIIGKKEDVSAKDLPVNPLATQCGGPGKLLQERSTLCLHPDCKGPLPEEVTSEMDLTLSKDVAHLGWRHTITIEGREPIVDYEGPIHQRPDEVIAARTTYTFQARVRPTVKGLKTKIGIKYEFFDMTDKSVELCVEAKYEFI